MPELFPYQVAGAKFLAERGRALLADEMGLGKSAQAIAACDALKATSVIVVCPASVVENWNREIERFRKIKWGICVFSYDRVRQYVDAMGKHGRPPAACDVLILDEAHYLKNPKAKRTQAIFGDKCDGTSGLVSRARHVFCLTGTPTPNHPAELWPMLRAVMPDLITNGKGKPLSYWTFVNNYCRTRDNGFGIQIVGGKNMFALKQRIAARVLRRKKEEVLKDLPPIRFDELPLSGELKLPKEAVDQSWVIQEILDTKGVEGLKEVAPHVAQLRRLTGLAKVAPIVEWIKEWIEGGGGKLVVFAHHRDVISNLKLRLGKHIIHDVRDDDLVTPDGLEDVSTAVVAGNTTDRQRQVDRFQNDDRCRVFIGQIQAAGTGITLTASSDVLFVESSWVPAENEQAAMRVHRIGQRNACMVRFATLAGSIDERIQRAVMRKTQDISQLFG